MRYWANPVTCQRQSQLQLRPIAATIALCKHPVRGLTKPPAASVVRLFSRTLSCLYTSRRCVMVSPIYGKYRYLANVHSVTFRILSFRTLPFILQKKSASNFPQITRSQLSAFRVPQNTSSPTNNPHPNPTSDTRSSSARVKIPGTSWKQWSNAFQ